MSGFELDLTRTLKVDSYGTFSIPIHDFLISVTVIYGLTQLLISLQSHSKVTIDTTIPVFSDRMPLKLLMIQQQGSYVAGQHIKY